MKINIEDYLQKIDAIFKEKTPKDTYMIYILVFGVIFAISYLLFWEGAEGDFKNTTVQIAKEEKNINDLKKWFRNNNDAKIVKIAREIKSDEQQLLSMKDDNDYIKSKLETISTLIYNELTWGIYIHSISLNAKKYHMQLDSFSTTKTNTDSAFGHMLDVDILCTGKFMNTLKFINSLEQNDLVVDIHSFNIKTTDKIQTEIHLSVWGIKYQ